MSQLTKELELTKFDNLFNHIRTYKANYQNMHLREVCQRNKKRCLRYLHIVHVKKDKVNVLEGVVSGREINVHYEIRRGLNRVSIRFLSLSGVDKEKVRFQERFVEELLNRMNYEKNNIEHHYPKREKKQFYIKRGIPGTLFNHKKCQRALDLGELSDLFLRKLHLWKFQLIYKEN